MPNRSRPPKRFQKSSPSGSLRQFQLEKKALAAVRRLEEIRQGKIADEKEAKKIKPLFKDKVPELEPPELSPETKAEKEILEKFMDFYRLYVKDRVRPRDKATNELIAESEGFIKPEIERGKRKPGLTTKKPESSMPKKPRPEED